MPAVNKTILRTLYTFTGIALIGSALILLAALTTPRATQTSAIAGMVGLVSCLGILALLWIKQYTLPRVAIPLILYALATYLITSGESVGVHDEAMLIYPLAVSTAGLLLGRRGIIFMGSLVVLTTTGAAFAELQGWLVNRLSHATTPTTIVVVAVLNTLATTILYILVNLLTEQIHNLQDCQNSLAEANRELETTRASLANQVEERTFAAETARNEAETARQEVETQMWQAIGQAQLAERMRGEQSLLALANRVISFLCQYLHAQTGLLYVADGQTLSLAGGYAFTERPGFKDSLAVGEGLVGQAAQTGEMLLLDEIPPDVMLLASGLGEARPRQVLIMPLSRDTEVAGVVEMATLTQFSPQHLAFLTHTAESIATSLLVGRTRQQVADLLSDTQRQASELRAREEELRAMNEELQAQAENAASTHSAGAIR